MTKKTEQDKISLNEAFKRLEQITAKLEEEEIDLEKSIPLLKEGLELSKLIKTRLSKLENDIEEIKGKFKPDKPTLDIDNEEFAF
jgi:exodeoxyribonuclease VII small subunit